MTGTVGEDLARLRVTVATHRVVNLVGPLGIGKSRVLRALAPDVLVDLADGPGAVVDAVVDAVAADRLVGVDGVDDPDALAEAHEALCGTTARVVLASRRGVLGRDGWGTTPVTTVRLREWLDPEVLAFAERAGLAEPVQRELVARLAGGVPLVADALCAAIHAGAPIEHQATVADHAAEVIVRRLREERPRPPWRQILRLLATIGVGDEELLDVEPDEFTAMSELSLVSRTRLGLAIAEPYRTILDLSHRWRRPIEHRTALTRAGAHRIRMLSETSDAELRKDLAVHGIFLADEPYVRAMLFPPRPVIPPIAPATRSDADDIGRLVREWALASEFDLRATDRLIDTWLEDTAERFHVARDRDGRPVALANLVPFAEAAVGGVEPVTQQFTDQIMADREDGMFVITGFWPDAGTGAAMIRRILESSIDHGMAVICTPKPEYQRLARGLGFTHHGTTQHDTYGDGHHTHVFSQPTQDGDLARWMARIATLTGRVQPPSYLSEQLAEALERVRTPTRLARSPLLAAPNTTTVPELCEWLTGAVEALATSEVPVDAEAGEILRRYYLGGASSHQAVAGRMHLSRATYFRRLAHGMATLTERFTAAAAAAS